MLRLIKIASMVIVFACPAYARNIKLTIYDDGLSCTCRNVPS
jgi:hypothetical protein